MDHDIVVIGSGLAGLRTALEASRVSQGRLNIGIVTKVQAMRSHSVAAEDIDIDEKGTIIGVH